ncbi:MAG: mechanosensitive ion channel family protein [Myxococcota bacterium]
MKDSLPTIFHSTFDKVVGWLHTFVDMLPNALIALLVVAAFGFASRYVARGVESLVSRISNHRTINSLAGTLARISVIAFGVFIALSLLHLDKAVTSLLAGVGVVGLALGFAFQDLAANFVSGVFMAIRRPFNPGDQVEVDGRLAKVCSIELRSTHLETLDGLSVIMPNRKIYENPIVNFTQTPDRRLDVEVGVAYCDGLESVRDGAKNALADLPGRNEDRDIEVAFTGFGGSSIDLVVRTWLGTATQREYILTRSEAIIRIKKAFDQNGITIPFPIRTLDFGARDVGGERLDTVLGSEPSNDAASHAAE